MRANNTNRRLRVWRKLTGIATAAALALSVLGGGTVTAATPDWTVGHGTYVDADPAPASGASTSAVSAGKKVGFFEWLHNGGTSNIAQLYALARTTPAATVAGAKWTIKDALEGVVRSGSCPTATPLSCSFGALNAGHTVYLVAAFTMSANLADNTVQNVEFAFNTTGVPPGKNQSHGDEKRLSDSVIVTKNGDAAGDFNVDTAGGLLVETNQKLTGKNQQATSAFVAALLTGVAVGDSPSLEAPPCTDGVPTTGFLCSSLTSLVSTIEVGNGRTFTNASGGPGIKVIVSFAKAPDQLSGSTPFAYHYFVDEDGNDLVELITEACTYDTGNLPTNTGPCLTVGNKQVTVWLTHNGSMRF